MKNNLLKGVANISNIEAKKLFKYSKRAIKDTTLNTLKADWDLDKVFDPNSDAYLKDKAFLLNTKDLDKALEVNYKNDRKEYKMAFVELSKEKNPKLVVSVNNALNYKDKDGELKQRQAKSALTDVLVEAGKVAKMDKGKVMVSIEKNGKYETYFANKMGNTNSIAFANANNKDDVIYLNAVDKNDGKGYFYAINDKAENGKELIEKIGIKEVQNQDNTKSSYVKATVRLKNDELKKELQEKGNNHIAILSKDEIRVILKDDLGKNTTSKEAVQQKPQKTEPKKKAFKPKAKQTKQKELDMSR